MSICGYNGLEETGLYYLQSRYYNPQWGRFLNADAFAATGQDLTGNNMFAYCGNNPINFKDPYGKMSYKTLQADEIWAAAQKIYRNYPDLLDAVWDTLY